MKQSYLKEITLWDMIGILGLTETSPFPSKKEIQNDFKKTLKMYHPDVSKQEDAHEKTILLLTVYKEILKNYDAIKEEYEAFIKKQKREENQWDLLVIEYKKTFIGIPSKYLLYFVHSKDVNFLKKEESLYIQYENTNYKLMPLHPTNQNHFNKICFIGLFKKPYLFAIPFEEKIKLAFPLVIQKRQIQWNSDYGIIQNQKGTIYIWNHFKSEE
ncbi:MAG: hypothetical protein ACK4UJ_04305 [Leptonema sp. (in: bacteria)]